MTTFSPALEAWNATSPLLKEQATQAGEMVVSRIEVFANSEGQPLTEWDSWMLRHGIYDLQDLHEAHSENHSPEETELYGESLHVGFRATVQRCIPLVRRAIQWEKASGVPSIKVWRGLKLPDDWRIAYDVIYSTNLPWTVSHVLQSVFMGAPELGEKRPWRSN